jgi:hypothetical protein
MPLLCPTRNSERMDVVSIALGVAMFAILFALITGIDKI